jgi:hypothetical protein
MKHRPEFTLENYNQVYEYVREYQQPRIVSKLAWAAFNGIYKPHVSFVDESAYDEFQQLRQDNIPQIFAFNHLTDIHDQFISAAGIRQVMPEAAGNTRVWTKGPLLRSIRRRGLGLVGDMLGGIPVERKKDNPNGTIFEEANSELFGTTAWVITHDQNLAMYPEGTHNKGDIHTLGTVRSGIGEVSLRLNAIRKQYAITPFGMAFDPKKSFLPRHAQVVVGHPIEVPQKATVEEITELTRDQLQSLVTKAFDKYDN